MGAQMMYFKSFREKVKLVFKNLYKQEFLLKEIKLQKYSKKN